MARLRDLLLAAALLAACGGEAAVAPPEDFPEPPDAGERAQADAAVDREGPDAAGSDASSSGADASARPDAGTSRDAATSPFPTPIRYLVVVVKENHTLQLLLWLPGSQLARAGEGHALRRDQARSDAAGCAALQHRGDDHVSVPRRVAEPQQCPRP